MAQALAAYGTLLKHSKDGGTTYTTIAEVVSISGPGLSAEAIDVTSHDSPEGWREYVGGLKDGGEVTFDINFIPGNTTHAELAGRIGAYVDTFQLVFPDNTAWTFDALITGFEPQENVDGKLSASVTLKITGKPTLA